ncbi:unnamed protein product [Linum trigynum]|uniref:Myb/SANT-like domain-containing protein n=1 Tax=Linum trigynum TaxID=586398 RepID=A0AAV2GTE4_9ROSI
MSRTLFRNFCQLFVAEGGMKPTRNVDIDEMVYTFLRTISQNEKNRNLRLNLRRFEEIISRSIHRVLKAVLRLNNMLMKKPMPIPDNCTNSRWKHFKCLLELTDKGQIQDGTCKNGVFKEIELMMENFAPGCGLRAKWSIKNRVRKLKHWYHSTVMMRQHSGFGWDDATKFYLDAEEDVWNRFLQSHADCKLYKRVPFLQFFDLEGGDSSSDDDSPPYPLDQMNSLTVDEAMLNIIDDAVEARINKKRPPTSEAGPSHKKKKKKNSAANESSVEVAEELGGLRPLIKESADTIARALGESVEYTMMRRDLLQNLEKIGGLTRSQVILTVMKLSDCLGHLKVFYDLEKEEDKLTLVLELLSK